MRRLLLALVFLPVLGFAQDSPYHLSWPREAVFGGGGIGVLVLSDVLKSQVPLRPLSELPARNINGLDRIATGLNSELAGTFSDVGLYGTIGLPALFLTGTRTRSSFGRIGVLYLEAAAINVGLTNLIKTTARRPRPYVYADDFPANAVLSRNDQAAFLSGHTSETATACFFTARVFADYYPDSPFKPYAWTLAAAIPATVGFLRVRAGRHYPTDVLAGYALGTAVGLLVPTLHKRPLRVKGWTLAPTGNGVRVAWRELPPRAPKGVRRLLIRR